MIKDIPNLMPFQLDAFNNDKFIQQEFLKLKDRFGIKAVIETGTCLAGTAIFLGKNFDRVFTIETNKAWLKIAISRIEAAGVGDKIKAYLGKSENLLGDIIQLYSLGDNIICWLDAHWNESCPLQDELRAIAKNKIKPVIVIHDFKVDGEPALGYDSYNGQAFTYEWIKPLLIEIYGGIDGYEYYYNSDATSTAVKRGIIYITPKQ
jgi:hypothetical protein